ncbi:MAG: type II toxin-antitoxin system RelB/DinJ family antitoxin [Clostridiales bacterium]|jgi:addiction module RelB/DinJ family antitoxin|nr:type II toxin-antitoxin system RelB/DinJ family antitoxin [Clostridiales bacterium]
MSGTNAKKLDASQINPKLKAKADKVFKNIGLTTEQAINVFLAKVANTNNIPFDIRESICNDEYIIEKLIEAEEAEAAGAAGAALLDGPTAFNTLRA